MRKYLVLLLVAAVAFFAVPAMAQAPAAPASGNTVDFYGQVWYATYWDKYDKDCKGTKAYVDDTKQPADSPWIGSWGLDETVTRFGARFKQGSFSAHVSFNANTSVAGTSSPHYRDWYAENNFGGFALGFGHGYTITYQNATMAARGGHGSWNGLTTFTESRSDFMKIGIQAGPGMLEFNLVEPYTTTVPTGSAKYMIPKIEFMYPIMIKTDAMSVDLKVFGGYQQLDIYAGAQSTDKVTTLKSYAIGAAAKMGFGALLLNASAGYQLNGREYGTASTNFAAGWDAVAEDVLNVTEMMGNVAVGYKVTPMFTPQVGYGMRMATLEGTTDDSEQTKTMLYFNVKIQLCPQISVTPEYAMKDNGEIKTGSAKVKQGKEQYFGAEWIAIF